MFKERTLIIATKHQKEKVIAPLFEKQFGVRCKVSENFDTDTLGTFTGEIEREHDALTTLRNKCLMAMELNNCDLGVANEGSFGPHPELIFAPVDFELVILIDKKHNIEIVASETSMKTNFGGQIVESMDDLLQFAKAGQFPSHAIILKEGEKSKKDIFKGIISKHDLETAFNFLINKYGKAYAETDMRAMFNPTRMKVIEKAFSNLIDKINSHCPKCNTIGFAVTSIKSGLPCNLCGFATRSTLLHTYTCKNCEYHEDKLYPDKKQKEDPMYCDICNP